MNSASLNDPCNRIESIPDDLQNVLSKFAIEFLTLRPSNIVDFGLDFFSNMQITPTPRMRRSMADLKLSMINIEAAMDSGASSFHSDVDEYCKSKQQSAHLYRSLLKNDLFKNHSDDGLFKAINRMHRIVHAADEIVEVRNDQSLYIIENGNVRVAAIDGMSGTIDENLGGFNFMQMKWKYGTEALTFTALCDTALWILDGATFQHIEDIHSKCRDYELILESTPTFNRLTDSERQTLADLMVTKRYQIGDTIYDSTSVDYPVTAGIYFIQEGLVSLETNEDADGVIQKVLLKSGQHFGEINAKDKMIIKSTRAMTNVRCAHLRAAAVSQLIRHPFSTIPLNLCSQCKNEF